jgi:hypothetical protein
MSRQTIRLSTRPNKKNGDDNEWCIGVYFIEKDEDINVNARVECDVYDYEEREWLRVSNSPVPITYREKKDGCLCMYVFYLSGVLFIVH